MADTSQQLRARLFRRFRGVEVGWVPCVACGAQLHHTAEPKTNPNRFEVMTVVDVAGGWRTAGCLPLCAVDAPVVASWSRDETIERLSADRLDSPVEAHGTARARTMRASDGQNVSAGAVIVPEVEGFLARRETLSGVVRWSIDGLTVNPDTIHALTASAGQLSNPYHGPDGRFAPKGTGTSTATGGTGSSGLAGQLDSLAAGKTITVPQSELAGTVQAMAADNRKLNLADVHVAGTKAFDGNLGVSRADMPQIPAANKQAFLDELSASGVKVKAEQIPARKIRSTQGEIDPKKVAGFIGHLDPAQIRNSPLLVSSDGYMLDGHHRWAAQVADGSDVTAERIGLTARKALPVMADFNRRNGIESRGFTIGQWQLEESETGVGDSEVTVQPDARFVVGEGSFPSGVEGAEPPSLVVELDVRDRSAGLALEADALETGPVAVGLPPVVGVSGVRGEAQVGNPIVEPVPVDVVDRTVPLGKVEQVTVHQGHVPIARPAGGASDVAHHVPLASRGDVQVPGEGLNSIERFDVNKGDDSIPKVKVGGSIPVVYEHALIVPNEATDEFQNVWHDERGRFAPKGTGRHADAPTWTAVAGGRPGMGDIAIPTRDEIIADGGPDVPHTILVHMTADGQFTPERQALHDRIVAAQLDHLRPAGDPPPVITFLGGGGGAGKSSAIKNGIVPERKGSATVNADDYKMMLPEAQELSARGDASWAGLTHEESSYLAKRVRTAALERHLDVTVDAVGSNASRVTEQTAQAKALGYTSHVSYVTLPVETGLARAQSRADNMAARGETPRVIRSDVLRRAHDGANHAFPSAAGHSDFAQLIDNGGAAPRLIATRENGQWQILDRSAWTEYLARAGSQPADITSLTVARLATMKLEVAMGEQVSLTRANQLSMALSCGVVPANMTAAEQAVYDGMKAEQDANPDAVYMPVTEDF